MVGREAHQRKTKDGAVLIGRAVRVSEDVRTLRAFIVGALNASRFDVSADAIDDLVDEIWAAPENAHLQKVAREHRGGSKNGDLEVVADEWVYVPFPPPTGYELRHIDLTGNETSEDDICYKIQNQYVEIGMQFPADRLTAADLENVVFNAAIRMGGATPRVAYFYVVSSVVVTTDVAPVTAATPGSPTVGQALATPDWLLPLWHWIDRLHNKSEQHAAVLQDLFNLASEGEMIAMALTSVEYLLQVLERECKTPPATSLLDKIGLAFDPASNLFNISDFHSKFKALRDVAKQKYVDECAFPLLATFRQSCDDLKKLDSDATFLDLYQKFDKVRSRYPATEHALQTVLAFYTLCRGHAPDGEDFAAKIDSAVHGSPDNTPLFKEIASIIKMLADNVVTPAAAMVGNAPGPLTMLVAFGKLHVLWQLKTPATAVVSVERYMNWAATLAGVSEAELVSSVPSAAEATRNVRLLTARIQATELAASGMHSSPAFLKAVGFLDVLVFAAAAYSAGGDLAQRKWLDAAADTAGGTTAGAGLVGAMVQLRLGHRLAIVQALNASGKMEAAKIAQLSADKLVGVAKVCGRLVAYAGIASGLLQIWQGIRDKDKAEVGIGTGTILVSLQPAIDSFLSAYAPKIGARIVVILADVVAEETAVAVGGAAATALASAGAVIGGIGAIVVLGFLIYKNRAAILAFLEQESTPGPSRACKAYLKFIESTKAFQVGPEAVKSALRQASAALDHAIFINYVPSDKERAELKTAGLSEDDLRLIGTIAPYAPDVVARSAQLGM
jgi:hypothetical protein